MPAGQQVTETSTSQIVYSLLVPVSPQKKLKNGRAEYEMLEEALIILTSSAAAAAYAADECRGFGPFIAHKLRNYLPRQEHDAVRNE
jgi:hypothetical protein